jgi:nucleoside 2-deoxyribosyltransferase
MITRGLLKSALAGVCFQALTVLASTPAPAADISQTQPIQAGDARVWFLREFDPGLSLDTATIYANGVAIGQSRPGAAFSVDLAPGTYTFTVPNDVPDGNQPPTVQLTAGAQVYFNIDAEDWVDAGEGEQDGGRSTLDVRQISAPLAEKFLPALTEHS